MVVRENELDGFITSWRDKLFSVQNTILELLEGLDRLETNKIIYTKSPVGHMGIKQEDRSPIIEESMGDDEGWGRDLVEVSLKEGSHPQLLQQQQRNIDEQLPEHFLNNPSITISSVQQDAESMDETENVEESSSHITQPTTHESIDGLYQCDLCEFSTKTKFNINRHMQLHEENPTQAEHQNLVQQAQINKAHMSIQSQLQKIKSCDYCDYTTKRSDFLKKHIQRHHPQASVPVQNTIQTSQPQGERRVSSRQYSTVAYSTTTSSSTAAAGQYSTASPVQYKPVSGVQPYSARHNVAFDKYSCAHCRYITTRIGDLKKHMATEHPKETVSVQL